MDPAQNSPPLWKAQFDAEIESARLARQSGNEGKARVCARRAAGIAAGEYLRRQDIILVPPSVIKVLRALLDQPEIGGRARDTTQHFIQHVDTDFKLPKQVDLLADALWLANYLLGEE